MTPKLAFWQAERVQIFTIEGDPGARAMMVLTSEGWINLQFSAALFAALAHEITNGSASPAPRALENIAGLQ